MKKFVKDMTTIGTFGFSAGLGVASVFALCAGVEKLIDVLTRTLFFLQYTGYENR